VGDQRAPAQPQRQLAHRLVERPARVHHLLGDAGESLDGAREWVAYPDERTEAVMQLAATDEHRPHLGDLAFLAGASVGLDVDGQELGRAERLLGENEWVAADQHPVVLRP
jgi:hypothetical protein